MIGSSSSLLKKMLLLLLTFAGVFVARKFLIPLAISAVLATLFLPLSQWLEKKNLPRSLSSLVCILAILAIIGAISTLVAWQINELTNDLSLVKQKISSISHSVQQYVFQHFGITRIEQLQLLKNQQASFSKILQEILGDTVYIFTRFILVLVYIFLLLFYRNHLKKFLLQLAPIGQIHEMKLVIEGATNVSQQYLLGLAKMIACLWVMYAIGFSILGVKNAIFFAILCGLLEIIPFVGNLLGTTITLLIATVHGASFGILGGIVITYASVQLIQGWLLEPIILGPQVKINPLFTIIALVVGELMWGIAGVVLAIPLIGVFKIICDHINALKPYGFLVGEIQLKKHTSVDIKLASNKHAT